MSPDPNLSPPASGADIRPAVGVQRRDPGPWIFGALAILGAVMLFGALDTQRRAATAPATFARATDLAPASSPPPLFIPFELPPPPPPPPPPAVMLMPTPTAAPVVVQTLPVMTPASSASVQPMSPSQQEPRATPQRSLQAGNVVVYDRAAGAVDRAGTSGSSQAGETRGSDSGAPPAERARVVRLQQMATTVPQGTLIPAVLETALDSTRPGFVRALVTRDVRGFDGSRVLIPRGTRLFGEYRADLAPGQNRAFVRWTRLVRPDGTAMAVDSPAADGLGRAGVAGRVDTHFLERLGSAVLQSIVNLGVGLAGRGSDGAVIVALPAAAQTTAGGTTQTQPTLTVNAGTTVTVFVAQDLYFPAGGSGR